MEVALAEPVEGESRLDALPERHRPFVRLLDPGTASQPARLAELVPRVPDDQHPVRLEIPARSIDELRAQVIGRIRDVVWSAFITRRGDRIRIMSVRRARDEEKAAYLQD